tara:strand:- start:848 stop:1084 length:237 start_codon:yes stop_codon:yes gene_type:complete
MITDHTFECKGCLKFNTKDNMHFVYVTTEIIGTFESVSATFETYLSDMYKPMIHNFDLAEPQEKNSMYEIISIKEAYK